MIETNHKKIHQKLVKKGWDSRYIKKTLHILKNSHKYKHPHIKKLDKMMYWIFIIVMIITNIIVFLGIIPILIEAPNWLSYISIGVLGLCLGGFIDYVLRHIDIDHRHYISALIILPIIGMVSLIIILNFTKEIIQEIGFYITINPVLLLTIFILSYCIPHIIFKLTEK